jgi:hypothetical protein
MDESAGVKEFKDVKLIADGREIKQTDAMLKSGAASLGFTLERANEYAKLEIVAPNSNPKPSRC